MIQRVPLNSLFLTSYGYLSYRELMDKLILTIANNESSCYLKATIRECESNDPLQGYLLLSPPLDGADIKLPNKKILFSCSRMTLTVGGTAVSDTVDYFYEHISKNSEVEFIMAFNGIEAYKTPISIGKVTPTRRYLEVETQGEWVPYIKLPKDESGGLF